MIIAKNDCLKIEIHEVKYGGYKTIRIRSVGGIDREIVILRLKIGESESTLTTIGHSIKLRNETAFRYYANVKHSYLKTFGLKVSE